MKQTGGQGRRKGISSYEEEDRNEELGGNVLNHGPDQLPETTFANENFINQTFISLT